MPNEVTPDDGELRIVVVGREGHGKSTVANALVGKDHFTKGTKTTSADFAECSKNGTKIKVVDTPDISDNNMKRKDKKEEVNRWEELLKPRVNIILLVIKSDAPYTERDFIAYRQARRFLGGNRNRLVVAFTFADGQDVNEVGDRMEEGSPKWIGKVFKQSRGRFVVFNGKGCGSFLDEVIIDDDDDDDSDEEDDDDDGEKEGRKGSGKKRKGSGKGRRGSGGSGKEHGHHHHDHDHHHHHHHHKPKGGRGRRRGHSGKKRGGGGGGMGGVFGLLCCCFKLCKK